MEPSIFDHVKTDLQTDRFDLALDDLLTGLQRVVWTRWVEDEVFRH